MNQNCQEYRMEMEEKKEEPRNDGEVAEGSGRSGTRRGPSRSTIVWTYYGLLTGVLLLVAIIAIILPIFLTVEAGIEVAVAIALVEFVVLAFVFVVLFYKADLISQCPSPHSPDENVDLEVV